jgi:dynactin complex subunit
VYLQIYDDPEAELFTIDTLLIFVNILQISVSEALQKSFYRENSAMTQFRMIPEPYLVQDISPKV